MPFYRWSLNAKRVICGLPVKLDHVGHHLLKRRLELGLRQKDAARRLGVHPGGLENWEYGRTAPADRFMPAVIRFLGYNPSPAPKTLGEHVAYARIARGWSRKRLATVALVDEATVRRIEDDNSRLACRPVVAVLTVLKTDRQPLARAYAPRGGPEASVPILDPSSTCGGGERHGPLSTPQGVNPLNA